MEVPQKGKIELLCNPAIPLLDLYLEKNENTNSKRYTCSSIHNITVYRGQVPIMG